MHLSARGTAQRRHTRAETQLGKTNMDRQDKKRRSRLARLGVLISVGTVYQVFSPAACDRAFVDLTRIIDPCTTILANCAPGSFFANTVEIGSHEAQCFDPTCTLPGQCGGVPLGSFQDPCR